jgi:hypothetical protein
MLERSHQHVFGYNHVIFIIIQLTKNTQHVSLVCWFLWRSVYLFNAATSRYTIPDWHLPGEVPRPKNMSDIRPEFLWFTQQKQIPLDLLWLWRTPVPARRPGSVKRNLRSSSRSNRQQKAENIHHVLQQLQSCKQLKTKTHNKKRTFLPFLCCEGKTWYLGLMEKRAERESWIEWIVQYLGSRTSGSGSGVLANRSCDWGKKKKREGRAMKAVQRETS